MIFELRAKRMETVFLRLQRAHNRSVIQIVQKGVSGRDSGCAYAWLIARNHLILRESRAARTPPRSRHDTVLRKPLGLNWLLLVNMLALAIFGVIAIYSATYMPTTGSRVNSGASKPTGWRSAFVAFMSPA